jgi:tetratricopeptide (TPR) repeat protein
MNSQMTPNEIIDRFQKLKAALNAGNRKTVNEICFALLAGRAKIGDRWRTIAKLLHHNGEYNAAHRAMSNFVKANKNEPAALFEQAAILAQTGRLAEAWEVMQLVPNHVPDPAGNAFIRGSMAINLGSTQEAQTHLLNALQANPQLGQAMLSLAVSEKMDDPNLIGDRIINSENSMASAQDTERAHYQYALGKVQHDRGNVQAAYSAFQAGGQIVQQYRPYDKQADVANAASCKQGFDLKFLNSINEKISIPTSRSIFVTGLPRSGTTLVEQILASHSEVIGGEELGRMTIVESEIGGNNESAVERFLQSSSPNSLAQLYQHLVTERFGDQGRVVDKSLNISRQLGLVASILPEAPIIWLRRNPLDCAWSAFRTYFMSGLDWSWRLDDIAFHFKLEDALFKHWTSLLGSRILVLNYEELVNNPSVHIPALLKHCGLKEEPGVFEPHKTKRVVTTASVMQVREPINTKSVGSANRYKSHLAPFIEHYYSSLS